ncbi:MAG: hypothetical protein FRX49_07058 [Trebouxia sp. A1-2]|nr:MAG: hypothetical protein FRX49_07058 [Trebouxia sp. A1-2]
MISCDIFSLLQHDPLAPLSADGTTAAQLVFGKGRVQYNKEPASTRLYANLVRLAPREDALEGSLTLLQNMQLAAHLSLPPHFTPHRRASLIEEVLDLLALKPMQHCLVGSPSAGGLAAPERKLAAVATKLVTCPALLLLHEPLEHFSCPQDLAAAHHLLKSLTTAARQLHINVIMTQQVMQDADFEVVDHVVMLDQQARPVYAGSPDKAPAWFEYLGYVPASCSPVAFCSSVLLGNIRSTDSKDEVQQETLHTQWAEQGQAWQQCPPPKTPPSPTPESASRHKRVPMYSSMPVPVGHGEGMCDAPISSHWGAQNSPAPASAVVPRLALHRLPAPFGNAGGHSSQVGQSRLGLESAMVVAASFTSASLSYSEITSTGYTTRSPSPDTGLKSHFLHAAMSQREHYDDATLAVSNPLFGCSPKRGNSPDMVRCDSDDYGAVNPLFSSPALVRPSPLRAGPVAEGTEEGQDLHEALTRQGFSLQESSSSSHHSGLHWGQQEQSAGPSSSRLWSGLTHWLQKPKLWVATGKHGRQDAYEDAADHEAEPGAGRLRTDMIAIDVPSSRCSSVSHQSDSRGQHDDLESEAGEGGVPLPPLSTSSSPTRRLTKQASDAAAAVLLAISDANPIPRSPKPGPAPNRSWFVDVSPRRSFASLRTSTHSVHQLQPVSVAASRSFKQQLWRRHCLDLVVTVVLALLLGLLHGPAWQLQEVPAAALGATLSFGLLSLLAALPVFASSSAGSIAALQDAHQVVRQPPGRPHLSRDGGMAHVARQADAAGHTAKADGTQHVFLLASLKAEEGAATGGLGGIQVMAAGARQARVVDLGDEGMVREGLSQDGTVACLSLHAQRHGFQATQAQPAVKWTQDGALSVLQTPYWFRTPAWLGTLTFLARSAPLTDRIPPMMSEWPFRNLVADVMLMSAPKARGCWKRIQHKQDTASIEGSAAHLMSHLSECGNVTDLHAWVGGGF